MSVDHPPDEESQEDGSLRPPEVPERSWAVRITPSGELDARYFGPSSIGERDNEDVARDLLFVLNENGEGWGLARRPLGTEAGVDMEAFGPLGHLRVQITRVPRDGSFWRTLSSEGHANRAEFPSRSAGEIIEVVRSKAAKSASADRSRITLVLDAAKCPLFELPPVHEAFFRLHSEEASGYGFEDVLLVGSSVVLGLLSPPRQNGLWFSVS